ncbi:hypothetical protein ALI144C_22635 [Actinosynnema sp. ALI-1.44]|uniref:hypothetical protein n=1 Tax=Actinosynnema sp. ALI-1.44 TaxID=1933779 RepID=UPI00097C659F|nr:hypothetical protein [Actinosynnema sp. ALI-1.44]ONI81314.1 hypothetical protein ALI144C_22635 [Actinosynnema sp. ALI-1.44]
MAGVDYHAGCGSYVRLSAKDFQHPAAAIWAFEDMDHPATLKYPGVKVESCELAAGHEGLCEVFVDIPMHGDQMTYWLQWQKAEEIAESTSGSAARPVLRRAPMGGTAHARLAMTKATCS